jgi:tetratricopeptide (TPR) repeat protein
MRKFSFLQIVIFISVISYSQQDKVDSLQKLVLHAGQDTITAKRYSLIGYYSYPNQDSMEVYSNKGLLLSQKLGWLRGIAEAKYILVNFNNHSRSLSLLFDCLKIFEELKDTVGLIDCSFLINITYKFLEDYNKSVEYANKTLEYAKLLKDTAWTWNALYSLGNAYAALEQKDSALFYFQEAFRFANFIENPSQRSVINYYAYTKQENMGWSLHGLGRAQQLLDQDDLALNYYYKGLEFASRQSNMILNSDLRNSIATCYLHIGNRDSAIKYARITLDESLNLKYELNILNSYSNLAQAYEGINNDSAVKYYKLATEVRKKQFNAKNKTEVANLTFTEQERQKEIVAQKERLYQERKRNLEFASIGIGLITFLVIFLLLSQSIVVKSGLVKFLGVVALLLSFEFLNLLLHPVIGDLTHHSQVWMFLIMVCIAALLVPAHHRLEDWITHQLVEKNKRVRLAAAKKTIEQLEGKK